MSSTEVIKVYFNPPTGTAGGASVEYCDSNDKPLTCNPVVNGGTSQTFCLQLGNNNDWYFYAVSFWGDTDTIQSTLAEVFLDGWYKGEAQLSPDGKSFVYISDIYVNIDSNKNKNKDITFTVNNTNGSEGEDGTIGVHITFTNSDMNKFLTGRDPEIVLRKSPPG